VLAEKQKKKLSDNAENNAALISAHNNQCGWRKLAGLVYELLLIRPEFATQYYIPFTRSSKHRANVEQYTSYNCSTSARCLLDVC